MMNFLEWHNVIFLIPLVFGLLMILGSTLGTFGHGDMGHDIGHDVSHEVSHDTGHDNDHGARSGRANALDLHAETMHGALAWTLSFLGVGRVPFSIIIMMMALIFGGTGMSINYLIASLIAKTSIFALFSIGAALTVMFFLTGILARLVNRFMPSTESYNVTMDGLVGKTGKIFIETNAQNGFADVRDQYGNMQRIACRNKNDTLTIGTEIIVIQREEDGNFIVEPFQD